MIEQTLCEQLVAANRQLKRDLAAKDVRIATLEHDLDVARRRSHRHASSVCRLRNGRDLWRLRATRKGAA